MAKFKARARALDMLGRQQIAGIPTAINELFKNAHDAYADTVEVDFYREDGLFVLRDDGLGMTKEDFLERWLTLGTESKLEGKKGLSPPPHDKDKDRRPILGEKGIGRLAIASIGPQVLILSRAEREDGLKNLVAAFMHWGLFECPGIDLDEIVIPVNEFDGGTLPSMNDITEMVSEFRENLERLDNYIDKDLKDRMLADLNNFDIDPVEVDSWLGTPSLKGPGRGTHFIIKPTDESLIPSLDGNNDPDEASPLKKFLIGFTNSMLPEEKSRVINTAFRDHKTNTLCDDHIEQSEFFTHYEFENTDHQIQGSFDKYGQFKGSVSVYGDVTQDYIIPWENAAGSETACGPFTIHLSCIQGKQNQTTIPDTEYARILKKSNMIGGLYIYKNGVRMLPYGGPDYDYLGIETRRSKSAYYYYFSYRKLFGYIDISNENNSNLKEKAGREGFIENKAYRQFKEILINFLLKLAADFFRDDGAYSDRFKEKRDELEQRAIALEKRKQRVAERKAEFKKQLTSFFKKVDEGIPHEESKGFINSVKELFKTIPLKNPEEASKEFIDKEAKVRNDFETWKSSYRVSKPKGIGFSKELTEDWRTFQEQYSLLDSTIFQPTYIEMNSIADKFMETAKLEIDKRIRIKNSLDTLVSAINKNVNNENKETKNAVNEVGEKVISVSKDCLQEIQSTINEVLSNFSSIDLSKMSPNEVIKKRIEYETQLSDIAEQNTELLQSIRSQLNSLIFIRDDDGNLITRDEETEAIESELLQMQEESGTALELVHMGIAVSIISHEFNQNVKTIRDNLRALKVWSDENVGLKELYQDMRAGFDHLDSYLTLFAPLQKRLRRQKIEISGHSICDFLNKLFGERFNRHNIDLKPTKEFLRVKIVSFPSVFYPVYVNLVDNSIFWLKDHDQPRVISLDAKNGVLYIRDNGPGVSVKDVKRVFNRGFTKKPGGMGLGLYVASGTLKAEGYSLELEKPEPDKGACFLIREAE